jgi:hypothetical protein
MVELTPGGVDDPDGQHAASMLAAYFNVEHTRAFRRMLWRWLAVATVAASLVEAIAPLLSGPGLLVALITFAAAATAAAAEWRAENTLRRLVACQLRTVERGASAR